MGEAGGRRGGWRGGGGEGGSSRSERWGWVVGGGIPAAVTADRGVGAEGLPCRRRSWSKANQGVRDYVGILWMRWVGKVYEVHKRKLGARWRDGVVRVRILYMSDVYNCLVLCMLHSDVCQLRCGTVSLVRYGTEFHTSNEPYPYTWKHCVIQSIDSRTHFSPVLASAVYCVLFANL